MKTRSEIERELEMRIERIKMVHTFGNDNEVDYERGYIHFLEWVLKNFNRLNQKAFVLKQLFQPLSSANQQEGFRAAWRWLKSRVSLRT